MNACKVHKIERVYVDEYGSNEANVVYWCRKCGAVQVKYFHEYIGGQGLPEFWQLQTPTGE